MICDVDGYCLQGNRSPTAGGYDEQGQIVMRQQYDRAAFTNDESEIRAMDHAGRNK